MNRIRVLPYALALAWALAPAVTSFGQQPQGGAPQQGNQQQAQNTYFQVMGQQQNPQWHQLREFSRAWGAEGTPHLGNFFFIDGASRNSGMTLAPADPAVRAHLNLATDEGLIVTALEPGSPAAAAGIHRNDVLLRLGDPVRSPKLWKPEDLESQLKAAGDRPVSLLLLRGGKAVTIKVQPRVRVSLGPVHPEPPTYWIGVSVAPVEPALRSQLQLTGKPGLIATEVVKDGPAAKAGVRQFDILLKFDGVELVDQAGLTQLVQSRGERAIELEIFRGGQKQEVKITPERRKIAVSFRIPEPEAGQWDIVLPGAIVQGQQAPIGNLTDVHLDVGDAFDALEMVSHRNVEGGEDRTSKPKTTVQRLDEMSAQIKELRQAIEALTKSQEKK
jgi:membrane-associated protease RseP (regulator of RpoE activity)